MGVRFGVVLLIPTWWRFLPPPLSGCLFETPHYITRRAEGDRSHRSPAIEECQRPLPGHRSVSDPAELGKRIPKVASERERPAVSWFEASQVKTPS